MKNLVEQHEISLVWHFTRLENLDGILTDGLIPRDQLEKRNTQPVYNDQYRFDGCKNAICCSIGHPNYKMFYPMRLENENQEWVVIGIKSSILWEKDCAFCTENAASNNVTNIPLEERKGVIPFEMMFHEIEGMPTREELGISNNCPTNPQAEVLVFDNIEPSYIVGAVFQTKSRADEYAGKYPGFKLIYHRAHFKPRKDYRYWQ